MNTKPERKPCGIGLGKQNFDLEEQLIRLEKCLRIPIEEVPSLRRGTTS